MNPQANVNAKTRKLCSLICTISKEIAQTSTTLIMLVRQPTLLLILSTIRPMRSDPTISPIPSTLNAYRPAANYSFSSLPGSVLATMVATRPDQYAIEIPVQKIYGSKINIRLLIISISVYLMLLRKESSLSMCYTVTLGAVLLDPVLFPLFPVVKVSLPFLSTDYSSY